MAGRSQASGKSRCGVPGSLEARSCFRGLSKALSAHLSDEPLRKSYQEASAQIEELLSTQPDVPVTQDSLAGFLNGFLLAGAQFATPDLIERHNDAMFAVIGGIYLLGAQAPLCCQPAQLDTLRAGFFRRLSGPLLDDLLQQPADIKRRNAAPAQAIGRMFSTTPDVPVNAESLAGFVLGVMYSHRFLPTDGEGLLAIMMAAYLLAGRSDVDPARSAGPGLW
jgi:hypothetical protein